MVHFVLTRNLQFSTRGVKDKIFRCRMLVEMKAKLFKQPYATLTKPTQPFEKFGIDFKGPLPSSNT